MALKSQYFIDKLGLQKHPEGGYFREVYRSDETLPRDALPERFEADRTVSTSIYFLLSDNDFSAFHRMKQDEVWHYHAGATVVIKGIDPKGKLHTMRLGIDLTADERPEQVIPRDWIFGAYIEGKDNYALVSCTVAPGFEFQDFELMPRRKLLEIFPEHSAIITRLTR
ncbi:MAG: cupin domain-containing protein [Lentisphaeria bacterium]